MIFMKMTEDTKLYENFKALIVLTPLLIKHIPKNLQTTEIYDLAIRICVSKRIYFEIDDDGELTSLLAYIPKELLTTEICELAVKYYPPCINYVPDRLKNTTLLDFEASMHLNDWDLEFLHIFYDDSDKEN